MEDEELSIDSLLLEIQKTSDELQELKNGLDGLSTQEKNNKLKYFDDIISSYIEKLHDLENEVGTDSDEIKGLRQQINGLRRENNTLQRQVERETISEIDELRDRVEEKDEKKENKKWRILGGVGVLGGSALLLKKLGSKKYKESIPGYKDMSRKEKRQARKKWREEQNLTFRQRPFGKSLKWIGTSLGIISGINTVKNFIERRKDKKQGNNRQSNKPGSSDNETGSRRGNNDRRESSEIISGNVVEYALKRAKSIAADNKYGYKRGGKGGNNGYDCCGLVCSVYRDAFKNAGLKEDKIPFTSCYYMKDTFTKAGFKWISPYDRSKLKPGDILLDEDKHTEIYAGNGQTIGAHRDIDGRSGDSSGDEISLTDNNGMGKYFLDTYHRQYGWDGVLRYEG